MLEGFPGVIWLVCADSSSEIQLNFDESEMKDSRHCVRSMGTVLWQQIDQYSNNADISKILKPLQKSCDSVLGQPPPPPAKHP